MADTDENREGVEPEEKEQAAPKKKVAKKKAAKKKVAKKKAAKKKVAKKKVAKKKAAPVKESVAVVEKPEVQVQAPAPAEPIAPHPASQGVAMDEEQEKNQLIGLWAIIAVVSLLLIGALSPSGEKPEKAHGPATESEAPKPAAQTQEAAPAQQQQAPASADDVAEKKPVTEEKVVPAPAADVPAAQQNYGPPETPADAPPGYWKYESGQWNYYPYQQEKTVSPGEERLTTS